MDVVRELRKAEAWLVANRKIYKNYARFATNWLNRALDRGIKEKPLERAVEAPWRPKTEGLGNETPPDEALKRLAALKATIGSKRMIHV